MNDTYRSDKLPPAMSVCGQIAACVRFCTTSKPTGSNKRYWSDKIMFLHDYGPVYNEAYLCMYHNCPPHRTWGQTLLVQTQILDCA